MDIHAAVSRFHEVYRVPFGASPHMPPPERLRLRLSLIEEEWQELRDAAIDEDVVEMADALGDIVYVCFGMAIEMGVNLNHVLAEIQNANMSKLDADGKPIINDGILDPSLPIGKVLKGPYYRKPDIKSVLGL